MIKIADKYKPVLTVHDAVVIVAAKHEAEQALNFVMEEMSKPPEWGKDLPISCEGGYADNYGDC